MNKTRWWLAALGVALGIAMGAWTLTTEADQERSVTPVAAKSLEAATAPAEKLCSVVSPGHWRDTIPMPGAASSAACYGFMSSVGATTYQLGCIFAQGEISLGAGGGGVPTPNCGW